MHRAHRLGKANHDSIYYQAWQSIIPLTDPKLNHRILTTLKHRVRQNVNKYRAGVLWNAKLAHRSGYAPTPACPLCGGLDGGNHIAGGCGHEEMRRLYQEAHNTLGRIILKATAKGSMGNNVVGADLGTAEKCRHDGAPVVKHRGIPPQLLPCPPKATIAEAKLHADKLSKLSRPDIFITSTHPESGRRMAMIVDLKTCSDTQPSTQLEKCITQHSLLANTLRGAGFADVRTLPILVGHSGTIYTQHTLMSLEALGIDKHKAEKCAIKLGTTACNLLDSIIRTRRRLEFVTATTKPCNRPPRPP